MRPSLFALVLVLLVSSPAHSAQNSSNVTKATKFDYSGNGIADVIFRNPVTGSFYNVDGTIEVALGKQSSDIPVVGDFDGDGIYDFAVRRPSTGMWYVKNSSGDNTNSERQDGIQRQKFGIQTTDIPAVGDYDGDGVDDFAFRRPSNLTWYIRNSSGSNFNSTREDGIQRIKFGLDTADIPVPADYNGDGITDIAVRRPSTQYWYILNSKGDQVNYNSPRNDGIQRVRFGKREEDIPVPADYDGDGIDDIAVRRPSTQWWYIKSSKTGEIIRKRFGKQADDIPMVADYDGDGKADLAVRRPSNRHVYILLSSDETIMRIIIGEAEDIPTATNIDTIQNLVSRHSINNDSDDDGLSDYHEELVYGTDPQNSDSDGDGLNDNVEVLDGTDPNDSNSFDVNSFLSIQNMIGKYFVIKQSASELRSGLLPTHENLLHIESENSVKFITSDRFGASQTPGTILESEAGTLTIQLETKENFAFYGHPSWNEIGKIWGDDVDDLMDLFEREINIGTNYRIPYTQTDTLNFTVNIQTDGTIGIEYSRVSEMNLQLKSWITEHYETVSETQVQTVIDYPQEQFKAELIANDQSLFSQLAQSDIVGTWAMPVRFDWFDDHSYYSGWSGFDWPGGAFSLERVYFASDNTASGAVGQVNYEWQLSTDGTLSLIQGSRRVEYRAYVNEGDKYMVFITPWNNGVKEPSHAALIVKESDNQSEFIKHLVTEFSEIYAEVQKYESHSAYSNGQLNVDNILGYQFKNDNTVNWLINYEPLSQWNGVEHFDFDTLGTTDRRYSISEDGKTIVAEGQIGTRYRIRYFNIISYESGSRAIIQEIENLWYDFNENEVIDEGEEHPFQHPQYLFLEKIDLSEYPEVWRNSDPDKDGLRNWFEDESGWDNNNPDTDGDGIFDGTEYRQGTDPLSINTILDLELIEDIWFRNCISNQYISRYSPNQVVSVEAIDSLSCNIRSPDTSLQGIEYLPFLTSLSLTGSGVTDSYITQLANYGSNLTRLHLSRAAVTDISTLGALAPYLSEFSINNTNVSDGSVIRSMTALRSLNIENSAIDDLNFLANLTNLEELYASNIEVSEYSEIGNLTNLRILELNKTQIDNSDMLEALTGLTHLELASTPIDDLSGLQSLTAVNHLVLSDTSELSDISALSNLSELKYLDLTSTQVTDISPLQGKNWQTLKLNNLAIGTSDFSFLVQSPDLEILELNNTGFSDFAGLTGLLTESTINTLSLSNNNIESLENLTRLTSLENLYLENNNVTGFSVLGEFSELKTLRAFDTGITCPEEHHLEFLLRGIRIVTRNTCYW